MRSGSAVKSLACCLQRLARGCCSQHVCCCFSPLSALLPLLPFMSAPVSLVSVSTQTPASHGLRSWLATPAGRWAAVGAGVLAAGSAAYALYRRAQQQQQQHQPQPPAPSMRPLHWVLKVGDLKSSVAFYSSVLGMRVQRHEEFDHGCEATCNGPYSGWWSKTMMSFPSTGEETFSLELTYNYGISKYETGNDLVGLHVCVAGAADRARAQGLTVESTAEAGVSRVQTPEGQWLYMHERDAVAGADPFLFVALHTTNLVRAKAFYTHVLRMREFAASTAKSGAQAGVRPGAAWVTLGVAEGLTKVQLIELPAGEAVTHAASFGRMAFGGDVMTAFARATATNSTVLHPPVTLDTPGKARVQVTILADTDGNEICVVNDDDFRALCVTKPGDDTIQWEVRDKAIAKQTKFMKAFNKEQA